MFSKISRYKKLPDIVAVDSRGRSLESKSIRLLPEVSGTFLHTVEEVDRLDHLAYKYYKQPRKWWRICDANPEFMSPRTLLGKEPIVTLQFPITFDDSSTQPPWHKLLKTLSQIPGVRDVSIKEDTQLVKKTIQHEYEGETVEVEVHTDTFERVVIVTYNHLTVTAADLQKAIEDEGFKMGPAENTGRIGKKIVIPPDVLR
ncbi:MAG: hypothetical protein GTO45_41080 [Candidatus Aminicenantes bacterium]|nr:hypothetical protein [Candidatus Aminicenantes bacterium]NIM84999.1 hypothetical protein [Candidatus Aminicenantes bacterium]NIN24513.1 hypothetical protein [Candidatus Aminicenantes bacterium]NIN48277.1 hypothetical protein [Candidatus Aminicenantes bacterium]NIN91180.1 hypothetical protein [Candidatus Aminicenantes bacterium]